MVRHILMIDFTIWNTDQLESGLNFQIARRFKDYQNMNLTTDMIDFRNSIVIREDAFSLVESYFASEFSANDRHHKSYHYGVHVHNTQSIEKIIDKLLERKSRLSSDGVNIEQYYWFTEEVAEYLNGNKNVIYDFINNIKNYLKSSIKEVGDKGIYVIGI